MPNRLSGPAGSDVKVSCALRALGTAVLTLAEAASAAAKEMLHACPFPGVSWQADTGPGGEGDSAEPGAVSQGNNSIQSISRCDKPPPRQPGSCRRKGE